MLIFLSIRFLKFFLCQSVQFLCKVWACLAFYQTLACLGKNNKDNKIVYHAELETAVYNSFS